MPVRAASKSGAPSLWVRRFAGLIEPGRPVLDVAAGRGRHSRFFLDRGHPVTALDLDVAAMRGLPRIEAIATDLESPGGWPVGDRRFGGVVVANYLWRPLFPRLIAALAADGVLIYETFGCGNEAFGRPARPAFLLRPGELLQLVDGLRVVAFERGIVQDPRPAVVERICAVAAEAPCPLDPGA